MSIYQIIQEIKATRSRNEKEAILKREQSNEDLKTFFRLALNPMINFYQKKKFVQTYGGVFPLSIAMEQLESIIAGRVKTGNDAIAFITNSINALDEDDAKVIMHILQKESGCDLGGATINKIWKDLIPEFPCLLATAYDDKLASKLNWTKGVFSQCLSEDWLIEDIDGNFHKISDIVNHKLELIVKSFDETSKEVCFKEITTWFDNGTTDENWYTITYEDSDGSIKTTNPITGNHKIYKNSDVWVTVDSLSINDSIM